MTTDSEIWTLLKRAKLHPCAHSKFEIDSHQNLLRTKKSYVFNCLKTDEGFTFKDTYVTIDRQNVCRIDYDEIIPPPAGFGFNAMSVINIQCKNFKIQIREFLQLKGDL